MLEALLMYTLCVSFCYIFHLDVHYVCNIMFVQRFEPQGMHFTNLHYYYYYQQFKPQEARARTHTHPHARMRARARTHAHTHTHTADNCNKDRSQKRYERLVELLDVERPVNRKRSDLRWRKKFHLISHTHSESSDTLLMALIRHTTLHTGRGLESE